MSKDQDFLPREPNHQDSWKVRLSSSSNHQQLFHAEGGRAINQRIILPQLSGSTELPTESFYSTNIEPCYENPAEHGVRPALRMTINLF